MWIPGLYFIYSFWIATTATLYLKQCSTSLKQAETSRQKTCAVIVAFLVEDCSLCDKISQHVPTKYIYY